MKNKSKQEWVLLIHQLPPQPTNLRVRVWRQLQRLGAVAIKNSVYVLPATDKANEDFQWLKQDIESAGGEVVVFRAASVEGATDDEIVATFQKARDEEYSALSAELEGLTGSIREQTRRKHLSAGRLAFYEAELNKLHAELERIVATDFFNARGQIVALNAYERAKKTIRVAQSPVEKSARGTTKSGTLDRTKYQGRRWVTRRGLHIDRLASAWLIREFIDKRPRFYFVREGETVEGAIPFDMFGAEFTHHGEDCTFETMLKRFGLTGNRGLSELAQIVHDIDLKDDKFHRLEAAGVNAIVNGLSATTRDDRKLLLQSTALFDGLLEILGNSPEKTKHDLKPRTVRGRRKPVPREK